MKTYNAGRFYPIGETLEHKGQIIRVTAEPKSGDMCHMCFLRHTKECGKSLCGSCDRPDNHGVYFKEIKSLLPKGVSFESLSIELQDAKSQPEIAEFLQVNNIPDVYEHNQFLSVRLYNSICGTLIIAQ